MIQIDWTPDRNSQISIRKQIVEYITKKILSCEWSIGSKIPPQRELAEKFGVNRSTIVSAIDELKSDGILESKGRAGTVVATVDLQNVLLSQPQWQNYIKEGIYIPNYETIHRINESEPDKSMLRLCSGEVSPEMFNKDYMVQVMNEVTSEIGCLGYDYPKGMLKLREELCKYLRTIGIHTSSNSILIVSGALQAIQLISIGLLQTGSNVLVEKPSYIYSLKILQTLGMRRVGIEMDQDGILVDQIASHLNKNRSSILYTIPNYHNPTGILMSHERRNELIQLCKKEKLPIVEDDVYGELWIDEKPPKSLKSLDDSGNVIYVGSVSKTLSPGLRIGWVVGPEPVINRLADIKMQMDYGSSSMSQLVVAKWLETGLYEKHLDSMRKTLKAKRDYALSLLDKYFSDIAAWSTPTGGYYVWITLHHDVNMYKVFEEAFKNKLLLYPGYIYDSVANNSFRISYSYASLKELEVGLELLSRIIRSVK